MEHFIALLPALGPQPILQAVVGLIAAVLCTFMVLRAGKDKQALPPPAPGGITDMPHVSQVYSQGPREVIDIIREQRDLDRRRTEDTSRIAECVRIIREEVKKQTDILSDMRQDARVEAQVEARVAAASERHHHP